MKVGISSASFYPDLYTEDSIEVMKSMGFDFGEIFLNSFSEYEESFIYTLKEKAEVQNFSIKSIHAFSSGFEPYIFDKYKRRRKDMIEIFKKVCVAARLLGAEFYTFHGMRFMGFYELNQEFIIDIYNELCYIASENHIKLCQENVSWCMSKDLKFLALIKEKSKYPLNFTLDLKQCYKAGTDPINYIEIMDEALTNLHINDKDKEHTCLLPGDGDIDYREIFNALSKVNYKGDAIIEVYRENFGNYKDVVRAKNHLKKLICNNN